METEPLTDEEMDDFAFLWREYALADDETLTGDAIKLKRRLIVAAPATVGALKTEIERLKVERDFVVAELKDEYQQQQRILDDARPKDEVHCGCCAVLRLRIRDLEDRTSKLMAEVSR